MDLAAVLPTIGIIMAAALGAIGVVYTARAAREAQSRAVEMQQNKIDAEAWRAQVDSWRSDVATIRQQRIEDLAAARADLISQATDIAVLRRAVRELEAQVARDRIYLDALIAWGMVVARLLRQAGVPYPSAPLDVDALVIPDSPEFPSPAAPSPAQPEETHDP